MSLTLIGPVALVAVDLQKGILGHADAADAQRLVSHTSALADAVRAAGGPVIWGTAHGMPAGEIDGFKPGGEDAPGFTDLHDDLPRTDADLVLGKKATSAFTSPDLRARLEEQGVRTVVVTGPAAGVGVESTVRAGFDAGYSMVVVTDALADPMPGRMEACLQYTLPSFSRAATTDDVLTALNELQS